MIIAELNNKLDFVDFGDDDLNMRQEQVLRMEDVLTSNVFGVIKNLDIRVINSILSKAGIESLEEKPEFLFWSRFNDNTEPDIIIKTKSRYIVIEVKYLSDFDKGNEKKRPQILREIEGAKAEISNGRLDYLAITREDNIDWYSKVYSRYEYMDALKANMAYLHNISWQGIYGALREKLNDLALDEVSRGFVKDLVLYLESKDIGYVKGPEEGRTFKFFFGSDSDGLYSFVKQAGQNRGRGTDEIYSINVNKLDVNERINLYDSIKEYIELLVREDKLRRVENKIAIDKIPLDLLFEVAPEEMEAWIGFITYLYKCPYVNLNGQNDISLKLHFKKGNYTKAPVSLFTYYRSKRIFVFRENR